MTDMPDASDDNLRHWSILSPTDPKQTKPFQRPGGFKGTAIKPIWNIMRLTEHFGPMGVGWGTEEPKFHVIDTGASGEILVFCTLQGWYTDPDAQPDANGNCRAIVWGIGGDRVASRRAGGMFSNDEAYKMAYTDALMNAFMRVGMSADVYMGLFDDIKYLVKVREHYDNTRAIQEQIENHPQPLKEVKPADAAN